MFFKSTYMVYMYMMYSNKEAGSLKYKKTPFSPFPKKVNLNEYNATVLK